MLRKRFVLVLARPLPLLGPGASMKLTNSFRLIAIMATIVPAVPAGAAQERERGRVRTSEERAVARDRTGDGRGAVASRPQTPSAETPRPNEVPRAEPARRAETRVDARAAAGSGAPVGPRRAESRNAYRADAYGRAVPRAQVVAPRVERPIIVAPRVYSPRYYYGGYYGYRPGYRPYAFRPWTRLSFGIVLGYPVQYAYSYPYPVPVYGYGAPSAPVYITPNSTMYGGITLEISPSDAEVFVDGEYVGQVRDFNGIGAPLNLAAGRHRLELNAGGYEPLLIDVDVTPGQLVPYRGDMQPIR